MGMFFFIKPIALSWQYLVIAERGLWPKLSILAGYWLLVLSMAAIPVVVSPWALILSGMVASFGLTAMIKRLLKDATPLRDRWEKMVRLPYLQPLFKGEGVRLAKVTESWFDVPANGRTPFDFANYKEAIEGALGVDIGKIFYPNGNKTVIRFQYSPEPLSRNINRAEVEYRPGKILFGHGIAGPYYVNLADMKHTIVAGKSGSGKTKWMQNVVVQVLQAGAKVCLIDFKSVGFAKFGGQKNVAFVNDLVSANKALKAVYKMMIQRERLFLAAHRITPENLEEYAKITGRKLPRVFVIIDEALDLVVPAHSEDKKICEENLGLLGKIAQKGRAYGVVLCLGTQYANKSIFGPVFMANLEYRVAFKCDEALAIMLFAKATPARVEFIPGRFYFMDKDEQLIQLQAPYWSREDFEQMQEIGA